ncbi:hypothetical protein M9H77_16933 [Catharanthus roseus]|uniref:Uncharacterized protein n=1 Tax=Catharanthus roseus TaxID=4058 RepID=A0ACC0B360_CATRO|nr:hypothetical protein M9H77_16933 [Catharanthus roseus]
MRQFARAQMVPDVVDTRLDLHRIQLRGNDNTSWVTQHAIHLNAWNRWRLRVWDAPTIAAATLSYPSDEYIRWYRGITQVYIGNPANRDTRSHGYQPASVDRRMMTSMLQELSRRRPREHVLDRGARGVKRLLEDILAVEQEHKHADPGPTVVERGEGTGSGQPYADPIDSPNLDMPSFSLGLTLASQPHPSGAGTSQMPLVPGLGFASFQSPHSTAYGFFGFRA